MSVPLQTKDLHKTLHPGLKEALSMLEPQVMQFEEMTSMSKTVHSLNSSHLRRSVPQSPILRNSLLQSRLGHPDDFKELQIVSKLGQIAPEFNTQASSHSPPKLGSSLTIFQLPDGTCVKLTLGLSYLLRKALQHTPIRYVIKDLYVNSVSEEVPSVFRHMFSLNQSTAITGVRELDSKCDVVIISPRELLSFKLSKTGFSVEDRILFNLNMLQDITQEAELHVKNMERHLLKPKSTAELKQSWNQSKTISQSSSQDYLHNRLLNAFEFVTLPNIRLTQKHSHGEANDSEIPITLGLFQTAKEQDMQDLHKPRLSFPKKASMSSQRYKSHRPERLFSKNFLEDSDQLVQLRQTQRFPSIARYKMPVSFNTIHAEKNAGFRKPEKREVSPPRIKLSSVKPPERAKKFLNQGELARGRAVRKVQERVISQIGSVEDYCTRYFLTSQEFMSQLEEFAVLALESSKGGIGVHPELLSNFYNTNIYTLRGLNPRLVDASSIDKLDIRQVITPSMLLSWQEFTLYYCLAVTQRALDYDILKFLFTLIRLTHSSQLKKEVLIDAMKSKFLNQNKFTTKLHQIWSRLAEAVISVLSNDVDATEYLDLEDIIEAARTAEVPVLELRYLAGELFVSHI